MTLPDLLPELYTAELCTLQELARHERALVHRIQSCVAPEWVDSLAELGFLPGETVQLLARGPFGGEPLMVRVGDSTFALRGAEAACVRVRRVAATVNGTGAA